MGRTSSRLPDRIGTAFADRFAALADPIVAGREDVELAPDLAEARFPDFLEPLLLWRDALAAKAAGALAAVQFAHMHFGRDELARARVSMLRRCARGVEERIPLQRAIADEAPLLQRPRHAWVERLWRMLGRRPLPVGFRSPED